MKIIITAMPVDYGVNREIDLISQRVVPNTAIYILGGILREKRYDIEILDPYFLQNRPFNENFDDKLLRCITFADIICLSANTLNWATTVHAINVIRERRGNSIKIILGGIHPTYFYEEIINRIDVDYIVRGEGESSLPLLIDAIINNKTINGITGVISKSKWADKKSVFNAPAQIDEKVYKNLPLPAYDLMPDKTYYTLLLETSRGCKFNCAFCSIPGRNNWRPFNESVVLERGKSIVEKFSDRFVNKHIMIADDCFTADFKRAAYIFEKIGRIDKEIYFTIQSRVTDWLSAKPNDFKAFMNPQIARVLLGIECGYNEGLKKISKGLTIEMTDELVLKLEEYGMLNRFYFSFIIGFPTETIDDCIKTIDYAATLVKRCRGIGIVNLNWLQWYPSNLWEERKKYGIKLEETMFDESDYNEKYFLELHPNFSYSDILFINHYITEYENRGIYLRNM